METWYRIRSHNLVPEPVTVARSTAHYLVMPGGKRVFKETTYESYHPSMAAAIAFLEERTQREIRSHLEVIELLKSRLAKIKSRTDG